MPLSVFIMIIPVAISQKLLTNHGGDQNAMSKKALSKFTASWSEEMIKTSFVKRQMKAIFN